ncbi:hypothetical protein ACFSAG_08425 [Sphingorhabdus buctiana]|uniref:Uncharacterized protein n=1 Tax=Sphingorhabdus buctiana TaxID=1508805 RepID=A0ABW4MDB2_9SPHN
MKDSFEFDIEAVKRAINAAAQQEHERKKRWGAQGPPVNNVFRGSRLVAAYNELLSIRPDATYHDFLMLYLQRIFGAEWWHEETNKTEDKRHAIVSWYIACERMMLEQSKGEAVVHKRPMPTEAANLLRLAFDLHQIRHLGLLLPSMVKRLKVIQQFQGARYEVAVAAAFARANFNIELEPEGKGPEKRCEFSATHIPTNHRYSVEAKSRHLPGVLGQPIATPTVKEEPFVESLVRKALDKHAEHQRIICIDVNRPHRNDDLIPEWTSYLRNQINMMEKKNYGSALIIFTNSPFHFFEPGAPARGQKTVIMGLAEPKFQPDNLSEVQKSFPGIVEIANLFHLPVPSVWD